MEIEQSPSITHATSPNNDTMEASFVEATKEQPNSGVNKKSTIQKQSSRSQPQSLPHQLSKLSLPVTIPEMRIVMVMVMVD